MNPNPLVLEQIVAEQQRYMVKVYSWMFVGLIITGVVAKVTASWQPLINFIFGIQ